ncbi:SMI1/KNR4 family protein [Aerococcus sp. 1KP-2016]|uniref:SMI1/KNR4 family protein n=1 Tax=Aerococcus sp. 1KP-2016 TaxID=1981982 RepID=UPI000B99AFCB|nr:SMI1/KNR4 family protein [Aerococcus sp. 1KP-2016]OYQ67729.1 hypothetical protein B9P78_02720 [Aerococcus sp. 1KP-2016]
MHLLASPLQKQFYTYLPKSPIYKTYSVADLPVAYHNLVNHQNGGYTSKSYVPTNTPTEDALNAVYIPYIAGMFEQQITADYHIPSITRQEDFKHRMHVPDTGIIFYEDQDRLAYMDYTHAPSGNQPSVVYMNVGLGQQITLAETFDDFIAMFEDRYLGNPAPTLISYHRINAAILRESSYENINYLIDTYGLFLSKEWQNDWRQLIAHYLDKPFHQFQESILAYSQTHELLL